jgi:hypothetical protein
VLTALEKDEKLTATRRRDLASAVRRVASLLGDEPAAIALDMAAISARLATVKPFKGLGSSVGMHGSMNPAGKIREHDPDMPRHGMKFEWASSSPARA